MHFIKLTNCPLLTAIFLIGAIFDFNRCNVYELRAQESQSATSEIGRYDRPAGPKNQSRSLVTAKRAMACTSDPRATQAALDVLKQGGNAIDAAIAANAVLGVVEPMSCGIGGDLYCILWDAKTQSLHGLNASGRCPQNLNRETLAAAGVKELPLYGPLTWSVPGCVAGWADMHDRFGSLPVANILQPAVRLAEDGFAVSPLISAYWNSATARLRQHPDSAQTYLIDGNAPKLGQVFRNRRLADTYRRLASSGLRSYYTGEIADQIVSFSQANGGYFSKRDFTDHRNDWVPLISTTYRDRYKIWQIPPNGQGLSVLQILNVLNQFDVAAMGWGSPKYAHLFLEAKKLAYADRAKFYADMAFEKVPVQDLNSIEYAKAQAARIQWDQAAKNVAAGDAKLRDGDTVYLCVVDSDRNCCSLIQSNFHGFGSQLVPGELGFALQNRGNLFSLSPDHPNRLEPGKRPFHTIIPSMVTQDDKPVFVFGVMGGDMQPQGQAQVLVNWIDFDMNIQMAGDAARMRHEGSATPTGVAENPPGGIVYVESGFPASTVTALQELGHDVRPTRSSMGGYQGIYIDWQLGTLQGATESRNDGLALGID